MAISIPFPYGEQGGEKENYPTSVLGVKGDCYV
jgi:hypothetical protein